MRGRKVEWRNSCEKCRSLRSACDFSKVCMGFFVMYTCTHMNGSRVHPCTDISLHHNPNNKTLSVSSPPPNLIRLNITWKKKGGEKRLDGVHVHTWTWTDIIPTTCVSVHTHKNRHPIQTETFFFSAVILMQFLCISFLTFPPLFFLFLSHPITVGPLVTAKGKERGGSPY